MATLTFEVSDSPLTRARETAQALNRPLEEVLIGVLAVGLPDVQDVPASVRGELLEMTFLDEESLWTIAKSEMASAEQKELQALLDVQKRSLVPQEEVRLRELRERLRESHASEGTCFCAIEFAERSAATGSSGRVGLGPIYSSRQKLLKLAGWHAPQSD